MEANSSFESGKKVTLEDLSKEDLVKRCKGLLVIAQKAKQAKDALQEENTELRNKLKVDNAKTESATNEIIENLTQQKLLHVTKIEDLKQQNTALNNKLQKCYQDLRACEEKNNVIDSENVSYKRQIKRLTDENEQLISHLDTLEKQLEECKRLGLEQQTQLLDLEKNNKLLSETNEKLRLQSEDEDLRVTLNQKLEEIEKIRHENATLKEKIEDLKMNLAEKDKNIITISEELQSNAKIVENFSKEIQHLKDSKDLQELLNHNESLKTANRDLIENNEALKQTVTENANKIQEFQENLTSSENAVKELQLTTEKLKERLKNYHSKIVKLAGNIKSLKENKNEILSLFKTYTKQVEEWKNQLNSASQMIFDHINSITNQCAELQKENQTLKENNTKFIQQLEAHKTDDEKSKEIAAAENLKTDNKKLTEEIDRLLAAQEGYKAQIEDLVAERETINTRLMELVEKHQEEIKVFDDQNKKDTKEIQNRIEENERICIEYRKIISKLEEDLNLNLRETEKIRQKNFSLQEEVDRLKANEREFAEKTSEEIFKLVQENTELREKSNKRTADGNCQTEEVGGGGFEEQVTSLKRENGELLKEMNEMNQALKERGETISKLQARCEEAMKKLQLYETQANKNVDSISQKDRTIGELREEVEALRGKEAEINELRGEIESLKERLDASYAESECMSTSTISRSEEASRLKDLEGSWEERYGKLRTLAVKLKGKVRDLSNELIKEQNEKGEVQQKYASAMKTVSTLQTQCDKLEDELEVCRKQVKEYANRLESLAVEIGKDRQKLAENEETIASLRKEIEELNQEKANTESWKKQISGKVQTFRKELEAHKVLKKEYETKIAKLTAELEAKEQALKAESDCHQQTKNSLEHSNNERKKNSVLNLEMQDYERSVKELSQKLEKKQEQVNKLKNQLEAQKTTANAVREQNKILEERAEEMKSETEVARSEVVGLRKQIGELEEVIVSKENKLHDFTQLLETARSENEELSTELSKVVAEHQKQYANLKNEKEHLRSQILGLQQSLRETQDTLKLREEELNIVQNDYENYKVRAQSVLRQNQSRDVGLEEKLTEQLSTVKAKLDTATTELEQYKLAVDSLKKEMEALAQEKSDLNTKYQEAVSEVEDFKALYDQLTHKHQQTMLEHSETVRSLKVHAETLAQCYRQQLSEQEVRHNREIIELQSKIEKAPSPTEMPFPPLPTMHREEGEGSESTETVNRNMHPVPLERLLGTDGEQDVAFMKKQLSEEESKVIHLTALLADTEQDLAKHVQMNKLLKEEIRRQQRSVEREKHAENLEYLKNVVFKFLTLHNGDERSRLVPVLNTILKLSPEETQKLNMMVRGDAGLRGWTNYLPLWSSPSKPS